MVLMAKAAGGLSLVDRKLALSPTEASLVNKYDMWSGSILVDNWEAPVYVPGAVDGVTVTVVRDLRDHVTGFWEPPRDVCSEEQADKLAAMRKLTGRSHVDCRKALIDSNWDFVAARELLV